jgi:FkbM family methyltransferase
LHAVRQLGARKYGEYALLTWRARIGPRPRAGRPFRLAGGATVVLDESTVGGVTAHWINSGQGIRELRAFERLAPGHTVLVDVGAGAGLFSAAFCALTGGRAFAFEPSPSMFERLQALVAVNPSFAIEASPLALGASAGEQQVAYTGRQFRAVEQDGEGNTTMDLMTLDGFVAEHGLHPTFAKIDVEGMELEVLRGGSETFRNDVRDIILELHSRMLIGSGTVADVERFVCDLGYRLYDVEGRPIADLTRFAARTRELPAGTFHVICRR